MTMTMYDDASAWSRMIDSHRSVIWGEVMRVAVRSDRLDPEDLCQESLIGLWRARELLLSQADPGRLIRVIARRRCTDVARHETRHEGKTDPVGLVVHP